MKNGALFVKYRLRTLGALAFLSAVVFGGTLAWTQTETPSLSNGQRLGAWTVTCQATGVNQTRCVLSQRLLRAEDQAFIADIVVFLTDDPDQAMISFRVPLGVHFPFGLAFGPAETDERLTVTWQACSAELCEGTVFVPIEKIRELEAQGTMRGGFRPRPNMEPVIFDFSIEGIGAGLDGLKG